MVEERKGLITMHGDPLTLIGDEIKVGDKAPDFTVTQDDMSPFSLSDMEDGVKILSVVPSLDTKVCQLQTNKFNEMAADLGDVQILTISVDLPFAQSRFSDDNSIDKLKIVSDYKDLDFGMKYGFVLEELRLLSRGLVILDKENTVKYVEYVKEVTEQPDYDKALEEVKKLI